MGLVGIGTTALGKQISAGIPTGTRQRPNITPFQGSLGSLGHDVSNAFGSLNSGGLAGASKGLSPFAPTTFGGMANALAGGSLTSVRPEIRPAGFPTFERPSYFGAGPATGVGATGGAVTPGGSPVTMAGGSYAALDAHNNEITNAANKFGMPGNLLKALINNESSGNWARDGSRVVYLNKRGDYILPFVGITKKAADSWGLNWNAMIGNKQAQIDGMATIMSGLARQYGGWDNAMKVYFMGPAALKGDVSDENGLSSNYYYNKAKQVWGDLDRAGGGSVNATYGNQIVDLAKQYLGVQYKWGSLPGADQDPWKTGWDCSAFVNWLDDKYGSNELVAGSHYQYADAQAKNKLFTDTNQLQAGDIVFFDTGWQGGAGANLNRAGHVGMYIGNGQVINALNPSAGTVISNLSDIGTFLGAQHMSWSSGVSGGGVPTAIGGGGYDSSKPAWFNALKYGIAA